MLASCARAAAARLRSNAASAISSSGRTGGANTTCSRRFASGSGGHDDHGVTYEGVTLHKPARWHSAVGTGMASLMWFWIFYRCYHDGDTLLFGHAPHFEHDDHHGSEEGHGDDKKH